MSANLADSPTGREHPASHKDSVSAQGSPEHPHPVAPPPAHGPATNGIWLALYTLTAVVAAGGAVLIALAVKATAMEAATAGGATFLSVLALTMTAHRFLKDR